MTLSKRLWRKRRGCVDAFLYWSGAVHVFESMTKPTGAIILMYHSVATDDVALYIDPRNHLRSVEFERQMAFLHNYRTVISLSALLDQLDAGISPPAGTVCITFDDGYLDNLTVAAPILAKYDIPATLYLPTAHIDRAQTHWADTLHQFFIGRTNNVLEIPSVGLTADLSRADQRVKAYTALHRPLLESLYDDREALLSEVKRQLKPTGASPRLTMNWEEVRDLVRRYPLFEIGGHSCGHIDLRTHGGEIAQSEMMLCRHTLQLELGMVPQHFSFPYSRWSSETRATVVKVGWRSAVGSSQSYRICADADRFVLARIETPLSMTDLRFKTSGAFPQIYSLIGK